MHCVGNGIFPPCQELVISNIMPDARGGAAGGTRFAHVGAYKANTGSESTREMIIIHFLEGLPLMPQCTQIELSLSITLDECLYANPIYNKYPYRQEMIYSTLKIMLPYGLRCMHTTTTEASSSLF